MIEAIFAVGVWAGARTLYAIGCPTFARRWIGAHIYTIAWLGRAGRWLAHTT